MTVDTVAALFSASILGYLLLLARHRRDPVVQKSGTHFLPFLFGGALLCQLSGRASNEGSRRFTIANCCNYPSFHFTCLLPDKFVSWPCRPTSQC